MSKKIKYICKGLRGRKKTYDFGDLLLVQTKNYIYVFNKDNLSFTKKNIFINCFEQLKLNIKEIKELSNWISECLKDETSMSVKADAIQVGNFIIINYEKYGMDFYKIKKPRRLLSEKKWDLYKDVDKRICFFTVHGTKEFLKIAKNFK